MSRASIFETIPTYLAGQVKCRRILAITEHGALHCPHDATTKETKQPKPNTPAPSARADAARVSYWCAEHAGEK